MNTPEINPLPDIEVTLKIHNEAGHTTITERLPSVLEVIKTQVGKLGKWLYVGNNRFKLDPTNPASVASLTKALVETPSARVTGSLRGGEPSAALSRSRVKSKSKLEVKKVLKVKKAKMKIQVTLPDLANVECRIRDDKFIKLAKGERAVAVFIINPSTSKLDVFIDKELLTKYEGGVGNLYVTAVGMSK